MASNQGGGLVWTQAAAAALQAAFVVEELATPPLTAPQSDGPWRPPQWNGPAITSMTVPNADGSSSFYVFDAVIVAQHDQGVHPTEHPVQTGANISDHAFILPSRLILDIGMSDAMDSYQPGMWGNGGPNTSKSVNAYQTLIAIKDARIPFSISTRLFSYNNMIIERIGARDSNKTFGALHATIEFRQIFMADVQTIQGDSARPQTTDSTSIGSKQPLPVPASISAQNQVPEGPITGQSGIGGGSGSQVITGTNEGNTTLVPGAGTWSSNKVTGDQ